MLCIAYIGINDDFFDLGGHSLKLMVIIDKIKDYFDIKISFKSFISNPKIKYISEGILDANIDENIKLEDLNSKNIYILNNRADKKIYAFPPLVGYGIAYKGLAKLIEAYSFYSFDFKENSNGDDFIKSYANTMININENKSFILLGYSVGGNLAFEVAKELEQNYHKVSDIILIDSSKFEGGEGQIAENIDEAVDSIIEELKKECNFQGKYTTEYLNKNTRIKVKNSINYYNKLENSGKINANIHYIMEEIEEESTKFEDMIKWKQSTNGKFTHYIGKGTHVKMLLDDENVIANAEIINMVLKSINK